nr:MAG TPA: hypothetical protein [Caudoviricetes sp.]
MREKESKQLQAIPLWEHERSWTHGAADFTSAA